MSEAVPLSDNAGSVVELSLKPKPKSAYTAYQNIHVKIGQDEYTYSEAWRMAGKGEKKEVKYTYTKFNWRKVPAPERPEEWLKSAERTAEQHATHVHRAWLILATSDALTAASRQCASCKTQAAREKKLSTIRISVPQANS